MKSADATTCRSPWPHRLALALALVTFPLVWVGGLVTSYEAGMAVPDWPSTYGYNLFLYPWQTWVAGPWDLFIEHGHRLLASLAGLVTLAFCAACFAWDARRWLRVLSVVAVLGVIAQGVLGGMRVLLDERSLARIHGCVGPAFFALTLALVVLTSRGWERPVLRPAGREPSRMRATALVTAVLAYGQIVLGAYLRHVPVMATPELFRTLVVFHIVLGLVLLAYALLMPWRLRRADRVPAGLWCSVSLLALLVPTQIGLGAGAWLVNYGWPALARTIAFSEGFTVVHHGRWQALVTTAHVAVGSLILATSVAGAIWAWRWAAQVDASTGEAALLPARASA